MLTFPKICSIRKRPWDLTTLKNPIAYGAQIGRTAASAAARGVSEQTVLVWSLCPCGSIATTLPETCRRSGMLTTATYSRWLDCLALRQQRNIMFTSCQHPILLLLWKWPREFWNRSSKMTYRSTIISSLTPHGTGQDNRRAYGLGMPKPSNPS